MPVSDRLSPRGRCRWPHLIAGAPGLGGRPENTGTTWVVCLLVGINWFPFERHFPYRAGTELAGMVCLFRLGVVLFVVRIRFELGGKRAAVAFLRHEGYFTEAKPDFWWFEVVEGQGLSG